jgi:ferredoxin
VKIIVDHERCAGTGMCESFAPEVFEVDDDGVLTLLTPEPDPRLYEQVNAAVEACPVEAIRVVKM